ncbi:sororin-B-like isoform X1 [Saccostrea cucullata]|uniref:sororin-B-like isoform X1 n=1 Tax=Saccostrea cuccullata TaxID=36930 RepID=UPI002ED0286D
MTTRRKTRQSALKAAKTDESSSSDSEYSKTLKIITKLSQKYLGTTDSKKKSTSLRSKHNPDQAYEGDEENTTPNGSDSSSTVSSKSKSSLYDFDEEDPEPVSSPLKKPRAKKKKSTNTKTSIPLSGEKPKSSKTKGSQPITQKTTDHKAMNNNSKKSKQKKSPLTQVMPMDVSPVPQSISMKSPISTRSGLKGKNVSFSPNVSEIIPAEFSPVVTLQKINVDNVVSSQRQLRKRKCDTPVGTIVKSPKVKKVNSGKKAEKKENFSDSGMFLSPEVVEEKDFKAQAVSTPFNSSSVPLKSSLNAYRDPALLNVSPVKKTSSTPVTPLSDYASMDSISHKLTFDDSITDEKNQSQNIELFTTGEEMAVNKSFQATYKPSKRKHVQKKVTKANDKMEEWMEKMNSEFSEIEGFELSIEDNV